MDRRSFLAAGFTGLTYSVLVDGRSVLAREPLIDPPPGTLPRLGGLDQFRHTAPAAHEPNMTVVEVETDVLVCGGGIHNDDLLERLRALLPGCPLQSTDEHGLDPDWVEAVLFAWLARERIAGRLQDTGSITGAAEPVLLGDIFQPRRTHYTA